jgi:hypothetical protein
MDFGRHHHQAGATPIGARRATTTLTASVWLMIAAGALAVGVLGDLPQPVTVAITGLFAAVALVPVAMDAHDRAVLREQADDLLRAGARVHPDSALLTWREAELTSGRNRKTLARSFSRIALELEGRVVPGPVPLSRAAREHVAEIRALSERLGDLERPVTARGMALVEDLITDGFGSPLYVPERAKALGPTLQRCLAELDDPKAFATCEGRV